MHRSHPILLAAARLGNEIGFHEASLAGGRCSRQVDGSSQLLSRTLPPNLTFPADDRTAETYPGRVRIARERLLNVQTSKGKVHPHPVPDAEFGPLQPARRSEYHAGLRAQTRPY